MCLNDPLPPEFFKMMKTDFLRQQEEIRKTNPKEADAFDELADDIRRAIRNFYKRTNSRHKLEIITHYLPFEPCQPVMPMLTAFRGVYFNVLPYDESFNSKPAANGPLENNL